MEQLTTIWKHVKDLNKWLRVKDITLSLADNKLKELQENNPDVEFKVSDRRPTKKSK